VREQRSGRIGVIDATLAGTNGDKSTKSRFKVQFYYATEEILNFQPLRLLAELSFVGLEYQLGCRHCNVTVGHRFEGCLIIGPFRQA